MNNHRFDSKDIRVEIKADQLSSLPFKDLQSRVCTATILQYTGYQQQIILLLQKLSHKSRAYIFNANGLQGFLIKEDYLSVLKSAHADGLWERVTRWHRADFSFIQKELQTQPSSLMQAEWLKQYYPSLYTFVLFEKKNFSEINNFALNSEQYIDSFS